MKRPQKSHMYYRSVSTPRTLNTVCSNLYIHSIHERPLLHYIKSGGLMVLQMTFLLIQWPDMTR